MRQRKTERSFKKNLLKSIVEPIQYAKNEKFQIHLIENNNNAIITDILRLNVFLVQTIWENDSSLTRRFAIRLM